MRYLFYILLIFSGTLQAQYYMERWPDVVVSAIKSGKSEVTGTIYGDTVYHFWQENGIRHFKGPQYYFIATPRDNGGYKTDQYLNSAPSKIYTTSFYGSDSIKYRQVNNPADTSGDIYFYPNGKVRMNRQVNDSIVTIGWQDETGRLSENKTTINGRITEVSWLRDTVLHGMRMEERMVLRMPDDTVLYTLIDSTKRIWKFKNQYRWARRMIFSGDTVYREVERNKVIREVYRADSILTYHSFSEHSYYESLINRHDQTGYTRYYNHNKLESGSETSTNKYGTKTISYEIVDGKKRTTATSEDLPGNRVLRKNYYEGKLKSKSIITYNSEGRMIDRTMWVDGEKIKNTPEDFSIVNPSRCGTNVPPIPTMIHPVIDSLALVVNGEKIKDIDRLKLLIKFGGYWMPFQAFESYLKKNYNHSLKAPEAGIKLVLSQSKLRTYYKLYGPEDKPHFSLSWSKLYDTRPRFNTMAIAYDAIMINESDLKKDNVELIIYLSLTDNLQLLSDYLER